MGHFGSQKVRSVLNRAMFNRSASNLVCAHDLWLSPPGKTGKTNFGPICSMLAMTLFGLQLGGLITLEPHVHDICNLPGICCIMRSKMWQCANFQFLSVGLFWGIFGPQNVRAVLNRAIFNHWVSNLDCAHDFKISPPAKQKTPILGNLCRFWGNAPF